MSTARPARRSRRVIDLHARLRELCNSFGITKQFIPADQYEVDKLHALRLLFHAAIEVFVEETAGNILDVTYTKLASGSLTHAGHHLLVVQALEPLYGRRGGAHEATYPQYDAGLAAATVRGQPDVLASAIKAHRKVIDGNNGIKAGTLRRLFTPLGYRESFFDPVFMQQATQYG